MQSGICQRCMTESRWRRASVLALESQGKHDRACSHQKDGWPLRAGLCAHPQISTKSNYVQTLQKSFGWYCKPRTPVQNKLHTHVKDPVIHVQVWWVCWVVVRVCPEVIQCGWQDVKTHWQWSGSSKCCWTWTLHGSIKNKEEGTCRSLRIQMKVMFMVQGWRRRDIAKKEWVSSWISSVDCCGQGLQNIVHLYGRKKKVVDLQSA